jgi:hypothetical protein
MIIVDIHDAAALSSSKVLSGLFQVHGHVPQVYQEGRFWPRLSWFMVSCSLQSACNIEPWRGSAGDVVMSNLATGLDVRVAAVSESEHAATKCHLLRELALTTLRSLCRLWPMR